MSSFSSIFFGIILIPYLVIVNDFTLFIFRPFPAFTIVTMFCAVYQAAFSDIINASLMSTFKAA